MHRPGRMRSPSGPHKFGQSNWRLHWLLCPPRGLAGTPDIAIRCNRQKQFVLHGPVDLQIPDGWPGTGVRPSSDCFPGPMAARPDSSLGMSSTTGVENHAVAAPGRQGRVGPRAPQERAIGRVVAVQAHENPVTPRRDRAYLLHRVGGDTGALNHLQPRSHRDVLRFPPGCERGYRYPLPGPCARRPGRARNTARGNRIGHGSRMASMEASWKIREPPCAIPDLDDQVRLYGPDQLLHGNDVLRVLDDRPAEPAEVVGIALGVGVEKPVQRQLRADRDPRPGPRCCSRQPLFGTRLLDPPASSFTVVLQLARGISDHHDSGWYILGHNGTSANHCVVTDADSGQDGRARTDEGPFPDPCFARDDRAGPHMDAVIEDAVMVNRRGSIDDHGLAGWSLPRKRGRRGQ